MTKSKNEHVFGILGEDIRFTIDRAIRVAHQSGYPVDLHFNDQVIVLRPMDDPAVRYQQWKNEQEDKRAAYLRSPEYAELRARQAQFIAESQRQLDEHFKEFPNAISSGLPCLVSWCAPFIELQDVSGTIYDHGEFIRNLEGAGYVRGEFVGQYAEIKSSLDAKGRWIIGQVLDGLHNGGLIPPILSKFAKDFPG